MIAALEHTHIVRVHDFGVDGDTSFLVMDYAPHGSLQHKHAKGTPYRRQRLFPMCSRSRQLCNTPTTRN
jgi:serine/threonine protein kinase